MAKPEQSIMSEQRDLNRFRIDRGEWAIRETKKLEEAHKRLVSLAKGTPGEISIKEENYLADKLESLLAYAKEKQGSPESEEILEAFGSYAVAMEDYRRMQNLLERTQKTALNDKWSSNDERFYILDGIKEAIGIAAKQVTRVEAELKKLIEKMK